MDLGGSFDSHTDEAVGCSERVELSMGGRERERAVAGLPWLG